MIDAQFEQSAGGFRAFRIKGHAGYADAGEDVVCAAVSSAVMLTANGITQCARVPAQVNEGDNLISCRLSGEDERGALFLQALHLHLTCLEEQYPDHIRVSVRESVRGGQ